MSFRCPYSISKLFSQSFSNLDSSFARFRNGKIEESKVLVRRDTKPYAFPYPILREAPLVTTFLVLRRTRASRLVGRYLYLGILGTQVLAKRESKYRVQKRKAFYGN